MDIDSLAQALFGSPRAETQEVATDGTTRTYMGVAMSDSDGGTVVVDLGGDVTLPDDLYDSDGNVVAEWDGVGVEMSTSPQVLEGEDVIVTLVGGSATKKPMVTAVAGTGDRQNERIDVIEADYVKATELEADVADIGFLKADSAVITGIQADTAKVHNLTAQELSAATGYVSDLVTGNVTAQQLVADHATIGTLDTTYMHADMANADVAWIDNGTIRDGAIVSAMINDVSANKLTAGTINGSVINVTNLNADNITAGTINGQRIGQGSLSLDKLSENVYTEAEVDTIVDGLNDRIDGAIETHTGTAVPTLNNSPASSWNTTALKDEHVGDVYYVVNSQSQQNGYCYRFTKSGSTYSWQLIKDSDVTAALSRLTTAEGKITSIESFDSTVSSFMTNTDSELTSVKSRTTSLETRMTDAEGDISEKVDTSTFNTLSQTVDGNSASITSMGTVLTNNGLNSSTNITNTVNTVSQTASGNSSKISQLTTTLGTNADGTTKAGDVVHRTSAVEQDLTGFKTTVSQTYATNTTVDGLATRVNTAESNITQNANNIALKVSESDVTGNYIVGKINLNSTTASIAAEHINLQGAVTISDLSSDAQSATLNSNISVGGRNLSVVTEYEEGFLQANSQNLGAMNATRQEHTSAYIPVEPDNTYVFQNWVTPTNGSSEYLWMGYHLYDSSKSLIGNRRSKTAGANTGLPQHEIYEITIPSGVAYIRISARLYSDGKMKLEKGNTATDWTPAPEDTPDQMTWYGTCSTAASTAAKVVECDGFELKTGARIAVKSTYINTVNAPTLNVNGTGAIATWYNNEVSSSSNPIRWGANATLNFVYDGTVWVLDERPPSYSATCSTAASTRSKDTSVVGALVVNGTRLSVRFSTANTYTDNSVQVNLSSTGAYSVYQNNAVTSTTNTLLWDANTILTFVAQGTYWHLLSRSDASKTATSYVTEITGQNGIMVHPSTDQTTGVQITSDVDIMRGGTSVAEYGETVRIGAENSDHVAIDSNELMFHDGTNAVMQVGGSCQITEKHVCGSSTSEVFYISLTPSNGAQFRVIDKNGEIVTSNYTLSRSGKRCTLTNKSGTALDGETVLVFYQSSGMVLYDEGDVSSTFTTDQASLAGGMFEMSYEDTYSSVDGTVTNSTAEISISKHRDQFSSISLNTMPLYNRSYVTFQASGNGYAAFVLNSGSTYDPERTLDLIYLDRINYADPYGGSDRQLGVPTRLIASGSYTAGTADTMGPHVTLTAGIWIINGIWNFANSSSNAKRLVIGCYRSSTGTAYTYRVHTTASSSSNHRLEVVDFIVVSATSETVTLYGASDPASTSAATQFITAVKLA